jgi:hypothetical protein
MIKFFKKLYYDWKFRNSTAPETVYIVARQPDELTGLIKILSIHKTLEGASEARKEYVQQHMDGQVDVRRYGLWE